MKTIAFNNSRKSWITVAAVVGGLTALYFYRRNGGSLSKLASLAAGALTTTRDQVQSTLTSVSGQAGDLVSEVKAQVMDKFAPAATVQNQGRAVESDLRH